MGIVSVSLMVFRVPMLGVKPPSPNAEHSSMREAPPSSAAKADRMESTQTSSLISWLDISLITDKRTGKQK